METGRRRVYDPDMAEPVDVLSRVPLFSMLPKREVAKLARDAHDRSFPPGTVLTDQGELGAVFTVIIDGTATVSVDGKAVRTLGSGDFFGEMALIDRELRSATVTAATDLRCSMITQWVFRPFAMSHPEVAWALLELMVSRVRDTQGRAG